MPATTGSSSSPRSAPAPTPSQFDSWGTGLPTSYYGGGTDLDSAETFTVGAVDVDLGTVILGAETSLVTGSVVDAEGDGVSTDVAVWRRVDGSWQLERWIYTQPDGSFRVRAPWGETMTLEADHGSNRARFLGGGTSPTDPLTQTFSTSQAGGPIALDAIELAAQAPKVVGRVLDENGDPLAGAEVTLLQCSPQCNNEWDFARTNANGRYVFDQAQVGRSYTVLASAPDYGYLDIYLGGGTDAATATTFVPDGAATTQLEDVALVLGTGVVRGRLTTTDGGSWDDAYVTLLKWDEFNGEFTEVDWADVYRTDRYAFMNVEPGTYTLWATTYDWDADLAPYPTQWRGGTRPSGPNDPGTFVVTPEVDPTEVDMELDPGVVLSGTVTGGEGQPLPGVQVGAYEWAFAAERGDYPSYLDSLSTNAQGVYRVRVPKNAELWLDGDRDMYDAYYYGGDYPSAKDPAHTLTTGTADVVHDFQLSPNWGKVGTVAGVQDEDCLTHGWWDDSDPRFGGRQLRVRNDGTIRLYRSEYSDLYFDDVFADDARDPALAPLQSGAQVSWGRTDDGRLCVLWNDWSQAMQVFLEEPATGPGLDVTYNYDEVFWPPRYPKAGWTAGEGPSGPQLVFDGWDNAAAGEGYGYTNSNTETGLIHNSLNSGVPGRYQFHFDGFEPRAAAPRNVTRPTITGDSQVGGTLTTDPGEWTIGGAPATDLEFTYTWGGVRGDAVGDSYVVQETDRGRRIWVEVRAWKPGHDYEIAYTNTMRIPAGPPAGVNTAPPSITPTAPSIGDELTADPGEWTVEGGAVEDLTFSYQWYRNGNRIWGATEQTYLTLDSDALKEITVRVKAVRPDHAAVKVFSSPVTVGDLPPVALVTPPTISGDPKVGDTVSLSSGTWDAGGQPVTLSYRFAADHLVRAADAGTPNAYTLKPTDRGRLLTVSVIAQAPGHKQQKWVRTIGPVAAGNVNLADLTVDVVDSGGTPVPGAFVFACEEETWTCLPGARSDADGSWTAQAWAGVNYHLSVLPPDGSTYRSAQRTVTIEPAGTTVEVVLTEVAPPPANVSLPGANGTYDGMPTVYWQDPQTFNVNGCAGIGSPSYTVTFSDGTPSQTAPMTQGPVTDGLATYTAVIPPFYPSHGETTISTNIPADCEPGTPPTTVTIYIDPSGVVTDQFGRPIEGATVTLLRADSAAGPFGVVPDGSDIMSPDNRTNPDLTDETGFFRWDVTEGWYRVQVDATGCDSFTTGSMQVPPPAVDLMIPLTCEVEDPAGTPTVSGTPKVGRTLTTNPEVWDQAYDVDVDVQWLRDGATIPGATDTTYVVTGADTGSSLSVRHTAQRATYVQEEGRGAPVSFSGVTRTSAGTAPVAPGDPLVATAPGSISGPGKVGTTLTATLPTWDQDGVTTTVAWLRNGTPIAGETGTTYAVQPGDVGAAIRARFTGTKSGFGDGTSTSDPVTGVLGDAPTASPGATVTGTPKVGQVLTATAPTWTPAAGTSTIAWLRDGVVIAGESASTYVVQAADVGKSIQVRYTQSRAGYADGTSTSTAVTGLLGDAPTASPAAALAGSGKVGTALTATVPVWNASGVQNSAPVWLRDNVVIDGETASTYVVLPGDVGKSIQVRYTGTKAGYADGTSTSTGVTGLLGDAPTASPGATVAGTPKVGQTLTATAPTWTPAAGTSTIAWLRDGVVIAGESTSTYAVLPGDVGKSIQVRYTQSRAGYADGTSTSTAVTGQLGDAPTAAAPTVSGTPKVGQTLTATAAAWSPSGATTSYQWLRDGQPIAGATGATYVLATDDAGRDVAVRVIGTRAGYQNGQAQSADVAIDKLTSKTTSKLAKAKVPSKKKGKVTVTVKAPGLSNPTGLVQIKKGKKVLAKGTIKSGGKVVVTLPKLKKGTYKLVAFYAGNDQVTASKSKAVTLKVT